MNKAYVCVNVCLCLYVEVVFQVDVEVEVPVPYTLSPPSSLSLMPYIYASNSFLLSAVSMVQDP